MGENSKIEWTRHTFNPWWGCVKVSPGCEHCYAETFSKRVGHSIWGASAERRFFGDKHWNEPLKWDREAKAANERCYVFVASMADWAERHRNVETQIRLTAERARLAKLIKQTPNLTWLMLTKRPSDAALCFDEMFGRNIPTNVLLGISAENQEWFDKRIVAAQHIYDTTELRGVFISAEPLLGPIAMGAYPELAFTCLKWVIVGGESGHGARPMHPDWARSLRDQCVSAGVAFHFKQWGEYLPTEETEMHPHQDYAFPFGNLNKERVVLNGLRAARMERVGKHAAGRMLDGRTWDEFPQAVKA